MDWAGGAGRDGEGADNIGGFRIAGLRSSAEMIATGPIVYYDNELRDKLHTINVLPAVAHISTGGSLSCLVNCLPRLLFFIFFLRSLILSRS